MKSSHNIIAQQRRKAVENIMKMNSSKTMKCVGTALAICSAAAMITSTKSSGMNTKKSMKKTVNKVADFVDTVASIM